MKKNKNSFLIVGGLILIMLIVFTISVRNSLITKEEKVKLQWSEVQNTYQRRLDLIPNLVNVVKGVSDFEQSTLTDIARARAEALNSAGNNELTAENYQKQKQLQDDLAASSNRMILQIEKYPTLKGTAAYSALQTQLEGTERRIKVARNDFNEAIADYNNKVRRFPSNIIAGLFGFKPKEGYSADSGTEEKPEVKF